MITWAVVITAFIVAFVNKLVEGAYGQALVALICGGILTAAALHSKTWLRKTNPNWMFAAALALLFAIISAPWVEQKRWPFSAWFYDRAATEAREETLIAWLQQDRRERDEARQDLATSEVRKATLVEWLQKAQQERDNAGKRDSRPGEVSYTLPA